MRHRGRTRVKRPALFVVGVLVLTLLPLKIGSADFPAETLQPGTSRPEAAACTPGPLASRAAAVLVAGLPDTVHPNDPLASALPKLGVGGVVLTARNVRSDAQVRELVAALRHRSAAPLLVTTDQEGGQVSTFPASPAGTASARSLADQPPSALERRGRDTGRYLRSLGLSGDLAPVADVNGSPDDAAIGDRSFSADPAAAGRDAVAVARGLATVGVAPVLKHFPGLGRADDDTHTEMATVQASRNELLSGDLLPFRDAITAGAPAIMVGHAAYPSLGDKDLPASLSPQIYALLRQQGFSGVAMTDSLGMGAVNTRFDYSEAAVRALAAGADALLFTDGQQAGRIRDAIVQAVLTGRLPEQRLNEAAARMTALSGGDPHALTCRDVTLPSLH